MAKPKNKTDRRGCPKAQGTVETKSGGKIGQPPFEATDDQRIRVEAMVACGTKQQIIADLLGFSLDTLTRHFRPQLDAGKDLALAKIGSGMIRDALDEKSPNHHDARKYVLARIGGWKTGIEHTGANGGPIEVRNLSDEEIDARIDALTGHAAAAPATKH